MQRRSTPRTRRRGSARGQLRAVGCAHLGKVDGAIAIKVGEVNELLHHGLGDAQVEHDQHRLELVAVEVARGVLVEGAEGAAKLGEARSHPAARARGPSTDLRLSKQGKQRRDGSKGRVVPEVMGGIREGAGVARHALLLHDLEPILNLLLRNLRTLGHLHLHGTAKVGRRAGEPRWDAHACKTVRARARVCVCLPREPRACVYVCRAGARTSTGPLSTAASPELRLRRRVGSSDEAKPPGPLSAGGGRFE